MDWGKIAQVAIPIVSGMIGQNQARGQQGEADELNRKAMESLTNLNAPDIEKMKLYLQQYQNVGELSPQMEQDILQAQSELSNISTDPKYNEYQMNALKKMAEVAENGASAIDRAQMQNLLNKTAAQNISQQKQILENRASRGVSGSGDELAAQLAAQQASQNTASNEAMQMAALLAQRKMDATKDLSNMSNAAETNEFNRKSQIASARDAINRFNASQQASTQSRNVSTTNEAMAKNLTNRQNIANQNVDLSNKQQTYNTGLTQADFDNKLRLGQAQTGAYSKMAANKQSGADATAGMWSNIGKGALDIFNAYKGASGGSSSGTMTTQDVNPEDLGDQGGYKKGNLWAR